MTKDDMVTTTQGIQEKLLVARHYAAVVTAFMLPFTTSGQAVAVSVLAVLALLTLDRDRLMETLRAPAAWIPLLLFAFLLVGVSWSMQPIGPALKWVGPYAKLLLIPLMMATSITPKQAIQIGYGFLASCIVILAISYVTMLWPGGPGLWFKTPGIPFKDNAVQSECFSLCAFGLAFAAVRGWRRGESHRAILMIALALLFFANVFLIYISKTGMLVAGVLLALFLIQLNGWRRAILVGASAVVIAALSLWMSPGAQRRLAEIATDIQQASTGAQETVSTASRIDFWNKAAIFVKEAPLLGHGTGSIRPLYQSMEASRPSPYGEAVADPHNQFLHVTLQIGLLGGLVLLAMWAAHAKMFLGRDMASVLGLAVVVQNFLGSLFNSHISQVTQGMLYCLAVGMLGSVVRGAAAQAASQPDSNETAMERLPTAAANSR
jgi:O-antigen ligase